MGARQSKRSVDISGKEAEGAGEVAAAGAGGEGRVEQLADADALKPQLNGDAHIHEPTDKEKELDSGTPENEKDATTEKENKEQNEEKDKDATPVSNGDGEKPENGESATTPEDGKKPKKEKVKKKWSLRSISFSRKDKPKQEKKQKEEEPKTNGEPEKVPEETAETSPEPVVSKDTEDVKATVEAKEEKAPDTPVTEPITNGSSTPESPKIETPAAEEITAIVPEEDKTEVTPEPPVPELPINGLSLEETKQEIPEIENKIEEIIASKPEETPVETTEVVPVPEIPVNKEVCVEQVPLIEPTPPPLPANPPPSSVASFAATTMAPELTDASLSNTAETTVPAQPSAMDSKTSFNDNHSDLETNLTNVTDVLTLPSKESEDGNIIDDLNKTEPNPILETSTDTLETNVETKIEEPLIDPTPKEAAVIENETVIPKIENKMEESGKEPLPVETGEALTEALESKINEVEAIEVEEKVEANVTKASEAEEEIIAESCHNDPENKEVEQNFTEAPPAIVENESKHIEQSSLPLDTTLPTEDTKDVITAEVASTVEACSAEVASTAAVISTTEITSVADLASTTETASTVEDACIIEAVITTEIDSTVEVDTTTKIANTIEDEKCSEISQLNEKIHVLSVTKTPIQPAVVAETIDVVELSPPVPIVSDEVDTQNIAMDESNDVDTQEAINPTSQIDSDNIESNIVTDDNKSTEITNTENAEKNKVDKEDNIDKCKDALGNVIGTFECNGNIDNTDTAQKIVEAINTDPPADDIITSNTEAGKEVATPDDSMPPSLSETNEQMPAGSMDESASLSLPPAPSPPASPEATGDAPPHIPQDNLPEKVCDKMAELITEISPVPELPTEMETSNDVAVAN